MSDSDILGLLFFAIAVALALSRVVIAIPVK